MKLWQNSLGKTANLMHTFRMAEAPLEFVLAHHTSSTAWVQIMLRRVFALLSRLGVHKLENQKASEEAGNRGGRKECPHSSGQSRLYAFM
jgi:hypothetical protein